MKNKNITLWTIQPIEWYDNLQNDGIIYTNQQLVEQCEIYDEVFAQAYHWLQKQMVERVGEPTQPNLLPIWAWYQYLGKQKKRPDLRYSGHLNKGEEGVRIEFSKPANQVLLSDYDLWHYVLNDWHIPSNKKEDKNFEQLLAKLGLQSNEQEKFPPSIRQVIENSWLKVLDLDYHSDYVSTPKLTQSIQATFWNLSVNEIVKVDKFIAK